MIRDPYPGRWVCFVAHGKVLRGQINRYTTEGWCEVWLDGRRRPCTRHISKLYDESRMAELCLLVAAGQKVESRDG